MMLKVIMLFYSLGREKIAAGMDFDKITSLPVRDKISRLKYIPEAQAGEFAKIEEELKNSYA
jgi:V/A-type H+-transporting ATPase subunit A